SPLSVLPILPTGLLIWATYRSTASDPVADEDPRWVFGAALGGPLVLAAMALAVIHGFAGTVPVAGPPVVPTVLIVLGVHALGAVLGLAQRTALRDRARRALPGWAIDGAALVPGALKRLVIGATALSVLCLACSLSTAAELTGSGGGFIGGLALIVVSLAYLPNVVIGALSVAVGPGVTLGHTTVTAFGAVHAPLPALPILAVVPQGAGTWWWLLVLVVPVWAAVALGRAAARRHDDRTDALRVVGIAAVLAGGALALMGAMAGGVLGTGAMSPISVPVMAFGAVGALWLAVVGAATVLTQQRRTGDVEAEMESSSSGDLADKANQSAD
ncbi:MAG: DUF6350 family protein, partial [Mycobacteriaceae bacterium]